MAKKPDIQTNEHLRFTRQRIKQASILVAILVSLIISYILIKKPSLDITTFTLERQSKSFLLVSTLKSSLAMLEGSDIGVGFRFELGDIVQSTYDLVDFTWKILLYGILLITFSKIFFESNLIDMGVYLLGTGFILRILGLFIRTFKDRIVSVGSGIIIAGLIASFYVPVSTFVSFRACEFFVGHIEEDLDHQMKDVLKEWENFKSGLSLMKLKDSIHSATIFMKSLFVRLTRILITFTCLIIIRYLLFPVVVAYGFFILSKAFLRKSFE